GPGRRGTGRPPRPGDPGSVAPHRDQRQQPPNADPRRGGRHRAGTTTRPHHSSRYRRPDLVVHAHHVGSERIMTAARDRPLQVVPDPHASSAGVDARTEWSEQPSAETVAAQWEPEYQLVGALLWHTAAQAKPILAAVPDDAIWRPMTRWIYELVRSLVDDGRDPDPVSVLNRAKHHRAAQAL